MAQWLRALAALAEDPGSNPRTHTWQLTVGASLTTTRYSAILLREGEHSDHLQSL